MPGWFHKHDVSPSTPEDSGVALMMVEEARARIDRQFSNNDAHDVKAAAVIAAAGVIAPVVISFRAEYGPSWPVPVVGAIAVAVLAGVAMFPRNYNPGPKLRDFYGAHGGRASADAARHMFTEQLQAIEDNRCTLTAKAWLSKLALWGLAATALGSGVCWLAWH